MKTSLLLALALLAVPALSTRAQWQQPPPQIDVSGSAEVKVAPDEVDLTVSVETRSETLDDPNNKMTNALLTPSLFSRKVGSKIRMFKPIISPLNRFMKLTPTTTRAPQPNA